MTNNAVHGVEEIMKVLREECRRSVKKEITSYDIIEYVSSEIPLFGKQVPIIAVKAKDSLAIPEGEKYLVPWVLDNQYPNCMRCNCTFTVFGRRHHCRACGYLVCKNCSNAVSAKDIVETAVKSDVRICRECQSRKKGPKFSIDVSLQQALPLLEAMNSNSSKKNLSPVREVSSPVDEDGWKLSPFGSSSKEISPSKTSTEGVVLDLSGSEVDDGLKLTAPYVMVPNNVPEVKDQSSSTIAYVTEIERLQDELAKVSSELQENQSIMTTMIEKSNMRKKTLLDNKEKIASLEGIITAQGNELSLLRDQVQCSQQGHISEQELVITKQDMEKLQSLLQEKEIEGENQQRLLFNEQQSRQQITDEYNHVKAELQKEQDAKEHQLAQLQQLIDFLTNESKEKDDENKKNAFIFLEKEQKFISELQQVEQDKNTFIEKLSAANEAAKKANSSVSLLEKQLKDLQATQSMESSVMLNEINSLKLAHESQLNEYQALSTVQNERKLEIDRLKKNIEQLQNELQAKELSFQFLQDTLSACQAELSSSQSEWVHAKDVFTTEIAKQASVLIAKEEELSKARVLLTVRDTELTQWKSEYEKLSQLKHASKNDHSSLLIEKELEIHSLKAIVQEKTNESEMLNKQLLVKLDELQRLKDEWSSQVLSWQQEKEGSLKNWALKEALFEKEKLSLSHDLTLLQDSFTREQSQYAILQSSYATVQEELKVLQTTIEEQRQHQETVEIEYKQNIDVLQSNCQSLEQEKDVLQQANTAQSEIIDQKAQELSRLQALFDHGSVAQEDLLHSKAQEIDALHQQLLEKNALMLEETQKRQVLEAQITSLKQELAGKEAFLTSMQEKNQQESQHWQSEILALQATLETEKSAFVAKKETFLSDIARLQSEITELASKYEEELMFQAKEKDEFSKTIVRMETCLSEATTEKDVLNQLLMSLQEEKQSLEDFLQHAKENATNLEKKRQILEQEVRLFKEQCLREQQALTAKDQELHKLQSQLTITEQELHEIKEFSKTSEQGNNNIVLENQGLIIQLQAQLQTLEDTIAQLNKTLSDKDNKVTLLQQEIAQKTLILDQLRQEFDKERVSWTSQMSYQSALLSAKDADLAMGQGHLATREIAFDQLSQAFALLEEEKQRLQEVYQDCLQEKDRVLQGKETQLLEMKALLDEKDEQVMPLKDDLQSLRQLLQQQQSHHAQELEDVEADFVTMEAEIAHYKEALDLAMLHRESEEVGVQTETQGLGDHDTSTMTDNGNTMDKNTNNITDNNINENNSHNNDDNSISNNNNSDAVEEEDMILRVPSYMSQVSYDPEEDMLETLSHVSDDTQLSMKSTSTSTTNNTNTKRNFLLENKQKVTKLSSAMKTLTNKNPIFEPSSTAKAKTVRSSLASSSTTIDNTNNQHQQSNFASPPPSYATSNTTKRASSTTAGGQHKPLFTSPIHNNTTTHAHNTHNASKTTTASAPPSAGQIKHHKLNYIVENKAEVKRTSEGVGILKKQSQQHIVVDKKTGTTVTASVMSTASLAVLKQSISHETHAEFVNSNYKSLGDLDGEKLQQLAHRASLGDLRLMMSPSTTTADVEGHLLSPKSTTSSSSNSTNNVLRRKSSLGATSVHNQSFSTNNNSNNSANNRRASTGTTTMKKKTVSSASLLTLESETAAANAATTTNNTNNAEHKNKEDSVDLVGLDVTLVDDEDDDNDT